MEQLLAHLADALFVYESRPDDPDAALAVDEATVALMLEGLPQEQEDALDLVVRLALEEDGFRFIPAARVLCAAIQEGF